MNQSPQASELKIAFCGGGSGGHLYPALAVLQQLRTDRPNTRAIFLTAGRGIEAKILSHHKLEQYTLQTVTGRDLKGQPLRSLRTLWLAWSAAQKILAEFAPDIVIGCGGYASVPGILAARQLKIPRLLLEQNLIPGRATSLLSRMTCGVCVSFSETLDGLPNSACGVWTGNPVRQAISDLHTSRKPQSRGHKHLLIIGGSQGAFAINNALCEIVQTDPHLLNGWKITHQTGAHDFEQVRSVYNAASLDADVVEFIEDMPSAYATAEIVISRAGATSLAEIACAGPATILVPFPNSVRDHQLLNAQWFSERQAAIVVEQTHPDFAPQLAQSLKDLIDHEEVRIHLQQSIRALAIPNAAAKVVNVIENRLSNT